MQSTQAPCSVEGCERPVKRFTLCYRHYMRQWRYGDPLHVAHKPKHDLSGERFGSLVVIEYQHHPGRTASTWLCRCDCGATTGVRTGDLNRGGVRSCGAVHHQLEETAEYTAAHERVYRARGLARSHACVDCGGPAAQWSYDHSDPDERASAVVKGNPAFSLKPEHYQARCVPCHKTFDLAHLATL